MKVAKNEGHPGVTVTSHETHSLYLQLFFLLFNQAQNHGKRGVAWAGFEAKMRFNEPHGCLRPLSYASISISSDFG